MSPTADQVVPRLIREQIGKTSRRPLDREGIATPHIGKAFQNSVIRTEDQLGIFATVGEVVAGAIPLAGFGPVSTPFPGQIEKQTLLRCGLKADGVEGNRKFRRPAFRRPVGAQPP